MGIPIPAEALGLHRHLFDRPLWLRRILAWLGALRAHHNMARRMHT